MVYIWKVIVFEFDDLDNRLYKKIITLLENEQNETTTIKLDIPAVLTFGGLEIRLHQRRVLRDEEDIRRIMVTVTKQDLIELGYGTSFAADIIRETKNL